MIISRSSGVSWCPCLDTACATAASRTSSCVPAIVSVQLMSLGTLRQSTIFRCMANPPLGEAISPRLSLCRDRSLDQGGGHGAGSCLGAWIAIHPRADPGAVVEEDQLLGQGLGIRGPRLAGQIGEQLVQPPAVLISDLVHSSARPRLRLGADERASA